MNSPTKTDDFIGELRPGLAHESENEFRFRICRIGKLGEVRRKNQAVRAMSSPTNSPIKSGDFSR